jgi:hypothetical protein
MNIPILVVVILREIAVILVGGLSIVDVTHTSVLCVFV